MGDKQLFRFLMVGIINTIVGMSIMFILYNLIGCTYWMSSGMNYLLTSILSFFLNKYFTFKNTEKSFNQIIYFVINIVICYILAYGIAKPICNHILLSYNTVLKDNISMIVGMCLFTCLNYFGQSLFTFKKI